MLIYSRSRGNHSSEITYSLILSESSDRLMEIFYELLLRQIAFLFLLETRREDIGYSPQTHAVLYGLR
eukprot:scaffold135860_cov43-Attheya_sp.AAC.1